jgi:hypothetical protein
VRDLTAQLEQEIADTERSLTFWREQQELQAGSKFADQVRRIVAGYEVQLDQLQAARIMLNA